MLKGILSILVLWVVQVVLVEGEPPDLAVKDDCMLFIKKWDGQPLDMGPYGPDYGKEIKFNKPPPCKLEVYFGVKSSDQRACGSGRLLVMEQRFYRDDEKDKKQKFGQIVDLRTNITGEDPVPIDYDCYQHGVDECPMLSQFLFATETKKSFLHRQQFFTFEDIDKQQTRSLNYFPYLSKGPKGIWVPAVFGVKEDGMCSDPSKYSGMRLKVVDINGNEMTTAGWRIVY